jgi:hypothetical protein
LFSKQLIWHWIPVFNWTPEGEPLLVVDADGTPVLEPFPLAHRASCLPAHCRSIGPASGRLSRFLPRAHRGPRAHRIAVLHFTYARSPEHIVRKLASWGHAKEVNAAAFLQLWSTAPTDWRSLRDVHPLTPTVWPALRPFGPKALAELVGLRTASLVFDERDHILSGVNPIGADSERGPTPPHRDRNISP